MSTYVVHLHTHAMMVVSVEAASRTEAWAKAKAHAKKHPGEWRHDHPNGATPVMTEHPDDRADHSAGFLRSMEQD